MLILPISFNSITTKHHWSYLPLACIAWVSLFFIFCTLPCFYTQKENPWCAQSSRSSRQENLEKVCMTLCSVKQASLVSKWAIFSLGLLAKMRCNLKYCELGWSSKDKAFELTIRNYLNSFENWVLNIRCLNFH